jgi:DNA-binding NarL/FixJ family response regulator
VKVVIGDKTPVMVGFIKEAVATVGGTISGEAWQPQALFDLVMQQEPDVFLIDLDMPGAAAVVRNVREKHPNLDIIGYMAASTAHRVLAARDAGTSEILVKPLKLERLVEAFEHVKSQLSVKPDAPPKEAKTVQNADLPEVCAEDSGTTEG